MPQLGYEGKVGGYDWGGFVYGSEATVYGESVEKNKLVGVCAFLTRGTTTIPDVILNNQHVKYINIGDVWYHWNPTEGHYDWSKLDSLLSQVPDGRQVKISTTMAGQSQANGDTVPNWVMDKIPDAEKISYYSGDNLTTIAVPWSPTWLQCKKNAIAAMGARYGKVKRVVLIEAAVFTGRNIDWTVPSGTDVDGILPTDSTVSSRMITAGYTHNTMVAAGATMFNAFAGAFPNSIVSFPTGPIAGSLEAEKMSVATEVLSAARTKFGTPRIMPVNYGLNNIMAFAPDATEGGDLAFLRDADQPTGGQALWNVSGDPGYRMNGGVAGDPIEIFEGFVDRSVTYVPYLEVYMADLIDPVMAPAIEYADTQLKLNG